MVGCVVNIMISQLQFSPKKKKPPLSKRLHYIFEEFPYFTVSM